MADEEFQKGDVQSPGGAAQLPQGAATQLEAGLAQVQEEANLGPAEFAPNGYNPARNLRPADDVEEVLYAEPQTPRPVGDVPVDPRSVARPVPTEVVRQLPMMKAMLRDPAAPPALKAAYRGILLRLQQELTS